MRLQVFLAKSGVCSRRKALEFITGGLIKVNSLVNRKPSADVDQSKDKVEFRNKEIKPKEFIYILLNKPKAVVTTKEDKFAPKKVIDLLPQKFKHLNPVGRLDKDTTGLLLLTNDGELLYRMTHPKFGIKKTYLVKAGGLLTTENKKLLEKGVIIDGEKTLPSFIRIISSKNNQTELTLEIREGRKRQIRLMFQSIGHQVIELKRTKEGILELGNLGFGQWRFLTKEEINRLYKETGLNN